MTTRKRRWHTKFAALLLLFMAGGTRQAMDAWREHKARSLECCTQIDDVRVAAPVDLSELRGVGAAPAGVIAPGPSHECHMLIHVRQARLGAMYARDGRMGAGLLLDIDIQVKGPSPRCDGSFAHLKVWDSSNGVEYRSAFSYWGGWLNITTVEHAAAAPPDQGGEVRGGGGGERLRQHTIVLPAEGSYWLEVMYDSEMYSSFLDSNEGLKFSHKLQPVRTVVDPWLDVPVACFNKTIPASSPGCDCDASRRRLYRSYPGYWAENRTLYVPLFHPRVTRWAAPPSRRRLYDGTQQAEVSFSELLLQRLPGGMMSFGTSRQRLMHQDMLWMFGLGIFRHFRHFRHFSLYLNTPEKASSRDIYASSRPYVVFGWKGSMIGTMIAQLDPNIKSAFEKNMEIEVFGKNPWYGRLVDGGKAYKDDLVASLNRANLCTKTSMRSVVIYSEGAHPAAFMLGPRGLSSAVSLVNETLAMLAQRCRGTKTTLMVASEMAAHDHWAPSANAFRDNRIVGFNAAAEEIALALSLPFIDVYPMTISADSSPLYIDLKGKVRGDVHHYQYLFEGQAMGDQVSVTAASAYLDAISDALDTDSGRCSIDIIEPFDGQRIMQPNWHDDEEDGCPGGERKGEGNMRCNQPGKIEGMSPRRKLGKFVSSVRGEDYDYDGPESQVGRCSFPDRRSVSIIVAASAACFGAKGASATLNISVDGVLLSAREQRLNATEGGTSKVVMVSVVELGQGTHVVSAACALPGCHVEEASKFELTPYRARTETRTGTAAEVGRFEMDGEGGGDDSHDGDGNGGGGGRGGGDGGGGGAQMTKDDAR